MGVRMKESAAVAAMCLALGVASSVTSAATIALNNVDAGLTSPEGYYRWMNAADQVYAAGYQSSYHYAGSSVSVSFDAIGTRLSGHLSASDLKPNFAYQLKLMGFPGTATNERVGFAGRWWEQEWLGAEWSAGWNLNEKGDGSAPNPNDLVYINRCDDCDATSPTGLHYRYTGYLVLDYFITDSLGGAALDFETGSSYHVLWKTSQTEYTPGVDDGPVRSATFDPETSSAAYDVDYPETTVGIYGEWERLPAGGVFLASGDYVCRMILTEESFHATGGTLGGGWAAAVGDNVAFTIVDAPLVPGDANGDRLVDGADLALWQQNYDPLGLDGVANTWELGNWSGDNLIDGADLALWQQNYDPLGPPAWSIDGVAAIPEPGTAGLVVLVLVGLRLGRARGPQTRGKER